MLEIVDLQCDHPKFPQLMDGRKLPSTRGITWVSGEAFAESNNLLSGVSLRPTVCVGACVK